MNASTAVGAILPDILRDTGGSVNASGQVIANKAAGTLLPAVLLSAAIAKAVSGAETGVDGVLGSSSGVGSRRGCGQEGDEVSRKASEHVCVWCWK